MPALPSSRLLAWPLRAWTRFSPGFLATLARAVVPDERTSAGTPSTPSSQLWTPNSPPCRET
eukprot:1920161-Pleurochrysis_carterae.AAC.1